jgi:signal transduction histidine kinase
MECESAAVGCLPGRILVVEDDRQILAIISLLLEDEGYEVHTAPDGRQALTHLREGPNTDLIILDLMLPALDGWEFRAIQREDPVLAAIPVLAVSADSSAKAAAIDATAFLRKPFGAEDLLGRVDKILRDRVHTQLRTAETGRFVALGRLAAEATHEISNPLCAVVANVSNIEQLVRRMDAVVAELPGLEAAMDPAALAQRGRAAVMDMRDAVRDLRVGTERMTRVLEDLRRRTSKRDEPFLPVDLGAVLESAIALTSHEIRQRARLVVEVPAGLAVRGHEVRLGQLFTNLLINAAHAIPKGHVDENQISIVARADAQAVTVEVTDTGSGITPEVRARLFEPFFTTKPSGVGTGLGLSICQSIVREHLGGIDVNSEPGHGSSFVVSLPLEAPRAVAVVRSPVERRPPPGRPPVRVFRAGPVTRRS